VAVLVTKHIFRYGAKQNSLLVHRTGFAVGRGFEMGSTVKTRTKAGCMEFSIPPV